MANAYKVLGQSAPAATTDTDVYTVPAATAGTFKLAVRPDGSAISNVHYIAFDVAISPNDSTTLTLGITLNAADVITVNCSSADMSVNVFGTEITA